jgi:uncharacterized protein (DUF2141 family)
MKTIGWILAAGLAASAAPALAGDLTVTLEGVSDQGGEMLVSLQTRELFMKPAGVNGAYGAAAAGTDTFTLHNVEPGEYAVVVMHDANSDRQMQFGPDGKPAEGWAMSGDRPAAGKPTFDQARVIVPAEGGQVTLRMVYPQGGR